jgi:hypothetical protein
VSTISVEKYSRRMNSRRQGPSPSRKMRSQRRWKSHIAIVTRRNVLGDISERSCQKCDPPIVPSTRLGVCRQPHFPIPAPGPDFGGDIGADRDRSQPLSYPRPRDQRNSRNKGSRCRVKSNAEQIDWSSRVKICFVHPGRSKELISLDVVAIWKSILDFADHQLEY